MVRVTKLELHRTISEIMKKGDLDQLTTKKIRILCEQKYNTDLSSRKEEIDRIVMAFVNKHCENQDPKKSNKSDSEEESDSEESEENSSGSSGSSDSDSGSESESSEPEFKKPKSPEPKKPVNKVVKSPPKPSPVSVPKKVAVKRSNSETKKISAQSNVKSSSANSQASKKPKKEDELQKKAEIDDAEFARKLQASEFSFRKRTANNLFREVPVKKTASNEPAKKKKSSAFQRKCLLSPALAEVLGTDEMSRPDIVQKMWSIVRERNLFDQSNKQYAILDEQLREVFGTKRVRLMGMMKYLKKHIKDIR